MNQDQPKDNPVSQGTITEEQLQDMKTGIFDNAKKIAMMGAKTVKNTEGTAVDNAPTYDWWENEQSFDDDFWSVSFWDYPNNRWQIQITKITIQSNGRSLMISYSVRMNDDKSFPGFQVYQESVDDSYRPLKVEEFVLLDRVLLGVLDSLSKKS